MPRSEWDRRVQQQRHILFALLSLGLLFLLGIVAYRESSREWMKYQQEYYKKLAEKTGDESLKNSPIKIQQIWLPQLKTVDRCPTCHQAGNNPAFKDEPQPLTTHPGRFLMDHPVEKFGCTICHQGDGQAVTFEKTHGPVEHLNRQLLADGFVQASCTKCHTELYDTRVTAEIFPEAALFIKGRDLTYRYGCRGCHTINGVGGNIGPELTGFGSRRELEFRLRHDFTYVEGPHTMAQWEYEHFLDPQKIVPGDPVLKIPPTIMPNFGFTEEQAEALTIFMLGLRVPEVEQIPEAYLPKRSILEVRGKQGAPQTASATP